MRRERSSRTGAGCAPDVPSPAGEHRLDRGGDRGCPSGRRQEGVFASRCGPGWTQNEGNDQARTGATCDESAARIWISWRSGSLRCAQKTPRSICVVSKPRTVICAWSRAPDLLRLSCPRQDSNLRHPL